MPAPDTTPVPVYAETDQEDLIEAAGAFSVPIRDIVHHEMGEDWDLYSDTLTEMNRLEYRLDQMEAAVAKSRQALALIHRRARVRALWEPTLRKENIPATDSGGALADDVNDFTRALFTAERETDCTLAAVLNCPEVAMWADVLTERATTPETSDEALENTSNRITGVLSGIITAAMDLADVHPDAAP
ncbi:hypothetical protein [Nocardiopsis sp. NRRL B-16309]|uniref:hypothetical protein n=1 Tax=Nocardiopsis sp. NRRL B-16309 TaxID=1519494 RepID=UPI0006AED613|nr:hypothetical protein [Nocardiopsis sp. NRRL B-16309]KOX18070.1 hypothetical protein ADL05_08135 [Nocardiopsis sp. NRRL B-16309]